MILDVLAPVLREVEQAVFGEEHVIPENEQQNNVIKG
jgi:hypothetical protein